MDALYARALPASRSGPVYGAFPYPTKISPEAIALFIAAHTKPGDTVFDGFAGSGTTGLGALLCENPSDELRAEAKKLGLTVKWGARNAVLYELSALGAFVARTLTAPPDPAAFREAAEQLLRECEDESSWMYDAPDPDGNKGTVRYAIWSDLLRCPACTKHVSFYDACVSLAPARIDSRFSCTHCGHDCPLDETDRVLKRHRDPLTGKSIRQRARVIARLYGKTGKKTWSRAAKPGDERLIRRIAAQPLPDAVPIVEIPWGDLYRRGYHQGITHLHHFYTRRNLTVFARLWEHTGAFDERLRDALRFWLLSYNASHATIMTRVVAKRGQKDLVLTSAQPGVLYISGLPVEKNLFEGLRRKLATIAGAFSVIHGRKGKVEVHQESSCDVAREALLRPAAVRRSAHTVCAGIRRSSRLPRRRCKRDCHAFALSSGRRRQGRWYPRSRESAIQVRLLKGYCYSGPAGFDDFSCRAGGDFIVSHHAGIFRP